MRLGFAGGADFLHREVAGLMAERLAEVTRDFPQVALIGTGAGVVAAALRPDGAGLTQLDPSPVMAAAAGAQVLAGDTLPLAEGAHDLVVSTLLLHLANDPVGQLIQMRRALKPDGLMLAALFGGQTLNELRSALAEAEAECEGGLSPRVAPMAEIRELGGLLQRAGFAMPVADAERLVVSYATPLHLMRELRAMGETNILTARRRQPMRPGRPGAGNLRDCLSDRLVTRAGPAQGAAPRLGGLPSGRCAGRAGDRRRREGREVTTYIC
jgi:SAM-dependent methyltransferase